MRPTNHLDLGACVWLEARTFLIKDGWQRSVCLNFTTDLAGPCCQEYLSRYPNTLLFTSHSEDQCITWRACSGLISLPLCSWGCVLDSTVVCYLTWGLHERCLYQHHAADAERTSTEIKAVGSGWIRLDPVGSWLAALAFHGMHLLGEFWAWQEPWLYGEVTMTSASTEPRLEPQRS